MSRPPRGLTLEETALWQQLASTVEPLDKARRLSVTPLASSPENMAVSHESKLAHNIVQRRLKGRVPPVRVAEPARPIPVKTTRPVANLHVQSGLDPHWERRLSRGTISPDFTLDLHGHTLDSAYHRLDDGLIQAKAMGAKVVLLITGKPRPVDAADRGVKRGAIRAKVLDWLAVGSHASDITSIRKAHPRHGGAGALYLLLRRG